MTSKEMKIYYGVLKVGKETAFLAATDKGLCWAGGFNENFQDMEAWIHRQFPGSTFEENQEKLQTYTRQFEEYFVSAREAFDFPLDLRGTPFQAAVWEVLQRIPYGETITYSDIAAQIKNPNAIRAVGSAVGKNPVLVAVPCHRVINKNGKLGGFRGGIPLKRKLLQIEKQSVHSS